MKERNKNSLKQLLAVLIGLGVLAIIGTASDNAGEPYRTIFLVLFVIIMLFPLIIGSINKIK